MTNAQYLANQAAQGLLHSPVNISVIVPTYNRGTTLPRAVSSILAQSYKNFDLWIVDDGSQDGTEDWVKSELLSTPDNPIAIHYVRTEQKGVSHARNVAIRASTGAWLAFLDSDDEWLPHKLEKQMEMAALKPELPLIHGEEIWVRNGVRVNPMKKHQKSGGRIFKNSVALCCISPSTSLIRRDVLNSVGLFREDFPVCEDYDLWLRITSQYDVGFVEEPIIVKYGGHEDQLSRAYKAMDYYRLIALKNISVSPHISDEEKESVRDAMKKKCEILLRGFERHDNWTHFEEVKTIASQI